MLTYRVASLQPRPVQTELLGTRTPVTYGNMTQARARDPNMHAAAGGMMRPKRYQLLLRPRNDICRPSIHSRVAALHREQHAGSSKPARRVLVDERPSPVPARSHGRSAACSRRRRDAEARTAAATQQRCAGGGAHRPHGFSHTKRSFRGKRWARFLFIPHQCVTRFCS